MMQEPLVLDIKCNSLDDGPGIRSAVFFKGCPLSCIWCHNPESKRVNIEISYDRDSCIGCETCFKLCTQGAIAPLSAGFIDRDRCSLCFECVDKCPAKALTRVGRHYSHEELLNKLLSDKVFYDISGGGVTLSGGEATMFIEWVGELARELKSAGVDVLLETCGAFDYDRAEQHLLPYLDRIYCDIKIIDRDKHKHYCGAYNDRILENVRRMQADTERFRYSFMPRTPLIPNITDTDENLTQIADFLCEIGVKRTDLLPYNPTWYSKADKLGVKISDELSDLHSWQSSEKLEHAREIFLSRNIEC